MEPLLIVITVFALVLAVVMAVVAWKLLSESRTRSQARVEALQALMADAGRDDEVFDDERAEVPAAEPSRPLITTAAPPPAPAPAHATMTPSTRMLEMEPELASASSQHDESWDLALRSRRAEPTHAAPAMAREIRPARSAAAAEPLFAEPEGRTPSHRWIALATVGGVMALAIGGIYAIYTTDLWSKLTHARSAVSTSNVGEAPLELLSLRHTTDAAGEFVVTGLVQNPATSPALRGVVAVLYLFDREGRYFASGRAPLDVTVLSAGGEAPFVIKVPATTAGISRYRVGFRQEDGGVVAHIDRRGELPGGTTGDSLEGTPAPTATPIAGPRRSEG